MAATFVMAFNAFHFQDLQVLMLRCKVETIHHQSVVRQEVGGEVINEILLLYL